MKCNKILLTSLIYFVFFNFVSAQSGLDTVIEEVGADILKLSHQRILFISDFTSPTQDMSQYLQISLMSTLTDTGDVQLVTRKHMELIDTELELQYSGHFDETSTISLCRRLGANDIVFGQLLELDNSYSLEIRVLDVETAAYKLIRTYQITRSSKTEQLLGRAAIYHKSAIGFHIETNINSLDKVAFAVGLTFDYALLRKLSLGIKTIISYDFFQKDNSITTVEPLGIIRFYTVSPTGEPSTGLYMEGQGGVSLVMVNNTLMTTFNVGLGVGFRFNFNNFYLEPELRGGYPYIIGAGLNFGLRF